MGYYTPPLERENYNDIEKYTINKTITMKKYMLKKGSMNVYLGDMCDYLTGEEINRVSRELDKPIDVKDNGFAVNYKDGNYCCFVITKIYTTDGYWIEYVGTAG